MTRNKTGLAARTTCNKSFRSFIHAPLNLWTRIGWDAGNRTRVNKIRVRRREQRAEDPPPVWRRQKSHLSKTDLDLPDSLYRPETFDTSKFPLLELRRSPRLFSRHTFVSRGFRKFFSSLPQTFLDSYFNLSFNITKIIRLLIRQAVLLFQLFAAIGFHCGRN